LQQSNLCKKRNPFYGKHHTKETKQRLSEVNLDKNKPTVTNVTLGKVNEQIAKIEPVKTKFVFSAAMLDTLRKVRDFEKVKP
jgi:hypothetical protein